ncbi:Uncharacterised protein [Escherichia coli]|uniref:Uncharacterized protein n=1 Tax=Escherichia coli TaxID=562 RepID=A0A2X3K3G7_ECOLX|nr:Uncharacterised protein [Escherichia coli]
MYSRSVFVWFVVGGFFGDGYILLLVKSMRVRFNGSHRQRSYQLTFASKSTLFRIPKLNIHAMQFGDSLDNR